MWGFWVQRFGLGGARAMEARLVKAHSLIFQVCVQTLAVMQLCFSAGATMEAFFFGSVFWRAIMVEHRIVLDRVFPKANNNH